MINNLPKFIIIGLLCTIIIENIGGLIIGVRHKKDFLNITLVNILTNPIVVSVPFIIMIYYGLVWRNVVLLILEIVTVLIEGFIYRKYLNFKNVNGYILSLILNLLSYFLGIVINIYL